jgi:hypothetical protein
LADVSQKPDGTAIRLFSFMVKRVRLLALARKEETLVLADNLGIKQEGDAIN